MGQQARPCRPESAAAAAAAHAAGSTRRRRMPWLLLAVRRNPAAGRPAPARHTSIVFPAASSPHTSPAEHCSPLLPAHFCPLSLSLCLRPPCVPVSSSVPRMLESPACRRWAVPSWLAAACSLRAPSREHLVHEPPRHTLSACPPLLVNCRSPVLKRTHCPSSAALGASHSSSPPHHSFRSQPACHGLVAGRRGGAPPARRLVPCLHESASPRLCWLYKPPLPPLPALLPPSFSCLPCTTLSC